jgi:hypothetical protein
LMLLIVEYSCYQPNLFLFFQAQWGLVMDDLFLDNTHPVGPCLMLS